MEKVRKKMSALTENFMEGLYYDREEYINQISYEEGKEEGKNIGIQEGKNARNIEIAKNMLKKKINIKDISEITGLKENEIKKITKETNN